MLTSKPSRISRSPSHWNVIKSFLITCMCVIWVCGCGCSESDTTGAFGPDCGDDPIVASEDEGTGSILVSDQGNSNIREFTGVSTLEGFIETDLPLSGPLTQLNQPGYLTIDPSSGDLIVPDEGSAAILFFPNPTTIDGNTPPPRVLSGPVTELVSPVQVFVDSSTDELYVLDLSLIHI